jgi:glycosyltransferase involved in cell wall biosynthesis
MNQKLKIVFLTPGTGGWYCGACMRDNALAKALQAAGHEVELLPMYLPLMLDEEVLDSGHAPPVFFGGIRIYLQQKFPWFRHVPACLSRLLNHPRLLRRVAHHSHMTSARDHGELTLAMLRMNDRRFSNEIDSLIAWLRPLHPDILCLSTALQAGMIPALRRHLNVKILCCFQGEDSFLDGLPEPFRDACWRELALRLRDADARISPSVFYANLMRQRLGLGDLAISVLPNGIDLRGYEPLPVKPGPPVIGFLARLSHEKGLEIMVNAFIHLRTVLGHPNARLHLAGAATAENQPLIDSMRLRLAAAGLTDQVQWQPNLSREEKTTMLKSLTLFSVPAIYPEAFGLYVIEAMASGVPVVQPAASSFPEIIARSGAGVLVPLMNRQPAHASTGVKPHALAEAWLRSLQEPEKLREMAAASRRAAERFHAVSVMRDGFLELVASLFVAERNSRTDTNGANLTGLGEVGGLPSVISQGGAISESPGL